MPEKTIGVLLEKAMECETKVANVFVLFSQYFSHVPEVASLWKIMIKEEDEHIELLREAYEALNKEQRAMDPEENLWEFVMNSWNYMKKVQPGAIHNLDEAYEMAHEMEALEVMRIFKIAGLTVVPVDVSKKLISAQIEEHLERLHNFSRDYGDSSWRKQVHRH